MPRLSMRRLIAPAALAALALVTSLPAIAASAAMTPAGYRFDAENVHAGVRWGYATLYREPLMGGPYKACTWERVPTAYGLRHRPVCGQGGT